MTTQHTPTPWTTERLVPNTVLAAHGVFGGPLSRAIADVGLLVRPGLGTEEDAANAAFIVLACNSHDALLSTGTGSSGSQLTFPLFLSVISRRIAGQARVD